MRLHMVIFTLREKPRVRTRPDASKRAGLILSVLYAAISKAGYTPRVFERFRRSVRTPKIKHASIYGHVHTRGKTARPNASKRAGLISSVLDVVISKIKHCISDNVIHTGRLRHRVLQRFYLYYQFIWLPDFQTSSRRQISSQSVITL